MKRLVSFAATAAVSAIASASALTDAFVAEARAKYPTAAYSQYTNSVLNEARFRKWEGRADLPPGETVRWIAVEGTCNFRDIGGWNGLNTGLVYRGAEPNCRPNPNPKKYHNLVLTEKDAETLKALGIRTDLDLRSSGESPTPNETPVPGAKLVRLSCSAYTNFVKNTAMAAKLLRVFADRSNYPIYFHCYGGADRTGSLAFLLEGLCGVAEEDLSIDYELTSFSRIGRRSRKSPPYAFAPMVAAFKSRPGATLRDKIEHYVVNECGLSREEVEAIRSILCGPSLGQGAAR